MSIMSSLFFEKRTTKITYTDNPESGELDIPRLLVGEHAFRDEARVSQLKPKAIILSGLNLDQWPKNEIEAFKFRLSLLAKDGFKFYTGAGKQIEYNDATGTLYLSLKTIETESASLPQLAEQFDIPVDELFLMDLDFAKRFTLGDEADYVPLLGKSEVALTVPMHSDNLCALLQHNAETLTSLDLSCCYNLQDISAIVALKDLPALPQLDTLTLDIGRYPKQLYDEAPLFYLLQEIIKVSPKLSKLNTSCLESLPYVLFKMRKLTQLCLLGKFDDERLLTQVLARNTALEELSLESINDPELLQTLFSNPLKKLSVFGCNDLQNIAHLEALRLPNSTINIRILDIFLQKAENLNVLDLSNCKNLQGELSENINVAQLTELILDGSTLQTKSLLTLLQKAKNLKKINLIGIENLPTTWPENLDFMQLEIALHFLEPISIPKHCANFCTMQET